MILKTNRRPPTEDDPICSACGGSGEGMHDGTTCSTCGGSGTIHGGDDPYDVEPPEREES